MMLRTVRERADIEHLSHLPRSAVACIQPASATTTSLTVVTLRRDRLLTITIIIVITTGVCRPRSDDHHIINFAL